MAAGVMDDMELSEAAVCFPRCMSEKMRLQQATLWDWVLTWNLVGFAFLCKRVNPQT